MIDVQALSDTSVHHVRRLGIGTVQFGLPYGVSNSTGQMPPTTVATLLSRAKACGIAHLDTAPGYGTSELIVGHLAGREPHFSITTKTVAGADVEAIAAGIKRSAVILGRTPIDAILIHDTKSLLGPNGNAIWKVLRDARDAGECRAIGISAYFDQDPRALALRFQPDVMQLPVSLLDQRLVVDGTFDFLKSRGVIVQARSIFLQGLPFISGDRVPVRLRPWNDRLDAIRADIAARGLTMTQALVGYALSRIEIDIAIVGLATLPELEETVQAAMDPAVDGDWRPFAIDDPFVLTPTLWNGS
jgi:D-threo-aldose 1-dehydrogenase